MRVFTFNQSQISLGVRICPGKGWAVNGLGSFIIVWTRDNICAWWGRGSGGLRKGIIVGIGLGRGSLFCSGVGLRILRVDCLVC